MPEAFLPRDLVYVYAHRDEFQAVAQLLGVPASAMAGAVAMETQKVFLGGVVWPPGGSTEFALNQILDQWAIDKFSHSEIAEQYSRFYDSPTPSDLQTRLNPGILDKLNYSVLIDIGWNYGDTLPIALISRFRTMRGWYALAVSSSQAFPIM